MSILFFAELVFTDTAELTGEIFGEIFPLYAGFLFVVNPAANITNITHNRNLNFPVYGRPIWGVI